MRERPTKINQNRIVELMRDGWTCVETRIIGQIKSAGPLNGNTVRLVNPQRTEFYLVSRRTLSDMSKTRLRASRVGNKTTYTVRSTA